MTKTGDEQYIGDGVYVSFVKDMFQLRTSGDGGDHLIYLEPEVWDLLTKYVEKTIAALRDEGEAANRRG